MAPVITPIKSFTNINISMRSLRSGLGGIKTKTVKLNNILLKRTKVKRESIARNYILSQRRQEAERRKNREDLIEASSIGGVFKRQAKAIASSTKGFLGRIMDFLGTLLIGWLMYNLPSIITMAQELIARMQRLSTIVTGFFNRTINIFRGFGNLLGAVGKNILTFDFTDSNKRVENAMKDLNSNFDDMQNQFDEGFRLLTTSLGEGIASGQNAAPFGTQYPNESFQPSSGEETKGGKVSPQAIYSYLKQKGLDDSHIMGILANIEGESDFVLGSKEKGGTGIGLFQWSFGRRDRFLQAVPDYKTNWRKQIDYALNEDAGPSYLSQQFSSPEQAADWWMTKWERPSERVRPGRRTKHNAFIKSFKPRAPQAQPAQTSSAPTARTAVVDQFKGKPGGAAGIITSERGWRNGRMHHGIDIAPAGRGYFVALKLSGTVDYIGFDSGGYGNFVDIKSENTIYRFAHLAKVFVKRGQPYNGQTIGEIGTTGGSTGIHLHFEVRPGGKNSIDPRPYLGLLSIGKGTQAITGAPLTLAQIKSPTTTTPQQLSQQRNGPTIVVIEEDPPAQQQVSAGGGGGGMIPIIINPLNSFITKKLLLDLAYT